MNLDTRIKSKFDILSCFDIEKAKEFVGQKGYFTDFIENYQNLVNSCYGTLIDIKEDSYTFKCEVATEYWRFFIPESLLKPKEKRYRPFKDTKEFFIKTNFEAGDVIHIRSKITHPRSKNKIDYWLMLVGWTNNVIELGTNDYTLVNLFENFELWDGEENFIPFGVLEDD